MPAIKYPLLYPIRLNLIFIHNDKALKSIFEEYKDKNQTLEDFKNKCCNSFIEAYNIDYSCLFPWTINEIDCRFEVPYTTKDGKVFATMREWVDYLDDNIDQFGDCVYFGEAAIRLGTKLLCD